jgi:hypothetical protein
VQGQVPLATIRPQSTAPQASTFIPLASTIQPRSTVALVPTIRPQSTVAHASTVPIVQGQVPLATIQPQSTVPQASTFIPLASTIQPQSTIAPASTVSVAQGGIPLQTVRHASTFPLATTVVEPHSTFPSAVAEGETPERTDSAQSTIKVSSSDVQVSGRLETFSKGASDGNAESQVIFERLWAGYVATISMLMLVSVVVLVKAMSLEQEVVLPDSQKPNSISSSDSEQKECTKTQQN